MNDARRAGVLQIRLGWMSDSGAYGWRLAERLHSEACRTLVSHPLGMSVVGFTEVGSDNPRRAVSEPIPPEDAFLVALQLRDSPDHRYWEDGRQPSVFCLRAGFTNLYDLKRKPAFLMNTPFHTVYFYFPREFLDAISDDANAPPIGDLRYEPGQAIEDPIMLALTTSLYPALDVPVRVNSMFVDHVTMAVGFHVAQTYGGMNVMTRPTAGGLAPWQERRAKEIIDATLDGEILLADLATECGLSASHFSRSFRHTTGVSPHRWILHRRIDNAKRLLCDPKYSLSEIALVCGFADHSHFTRVFTRLLGIGPASWRRDHINRPTWLPNTRYGIDAKSARSSIGSSKRRIPLG